MNKLEALFDAVIVKPIEAEETIYGNIIVPDMGKETNTIGKVIAVGTGRYTINGTEIAMKIKVGDKVILPTQGFTKLPFEGEEYWVGPENQILGRIVEELNVEQVLANTELTKEDQENLTDI
jgi:co-chaperonin GroES (HSP10)|uniref:Co-chaperonin GroES n=1 Tax=uncultured virus TaxID=340016 RepID=A0A221S405_9VIRU|nr:co-chaperonin GroES [uncultured virus]